MTRPARKGMPPPLMVCAVLMLWWPAKALGQMEEHHHQHQTEEPAKESEMHHHEMMGHAMFPALLGPYEASQDASGTAWQAASAPHEGLHRTAGAWSLMLHGFVTPVWTDQGGPRGDEDFFASTMGMARAARALGPGLLGLRAMLSIDLATIGEEGYPDLLQTGETSDGVTPLIDRQHPHDLFMELAASYSLSGQDHSVFLYGGLPGEPALGPPVYMHRLSGVDLPEAPITHHWLDSSHITYGVMTVGGIWRGWKLEGSAFRGREPDHERWDIEEPKLDSYSFRLSWNPSRDWAFQASRGRLESPEELEPEVDVDRTTISIMVNRPSARGNWQTTAAWGRNDKRPGLALDAFLLESALTVARRHTFLARLEHAEKDELFAEGDSLAGSVFKVSKAGAGYLFDPILGSHVAWGVGVYGTISFVPSELEPFYENEPLSALIFTRIKLR